VFEGSSALIKTGLAPMDCAFQPGRDMGAEVATQTPTGFGLSMSW
jgi:hypothetical protein